MRVEKSLPNILSLVNSCRLYRFRFEPLNGTKNSPSCGVLKVALRPGKVPLLIEASYAALAVLYCSLLGSFPIRSTDSASCWFLAAKEGPVFSNFFFFFFVVSLSDLLVLVPVFLDFLISSGTLSDMSLRVNLPLLKLLVRLADVLLLDEVLVLDFYSHLSVILSIRGLLLFLCSKRQTSRTLFCILRSHQSRGTPRAAFVHPADGTGWTFDEAVMTKTRLGRRTVLAECFPRLPSFGLVLEPLFDASGGGREPGCARFKPTALTR